jgi:hypothetical protein
MSNSTGPTSGAEIAYLAVARVHVFIHGLSNLVLYVVFVDHSLSFSVGFGVLSPSIYSF